MKILLSTLALSLLCLNSSSLFANTTTIKCWVNEDNFRECGSIVPPKYSSQGYEETHAETGIVIKEVAAEKSAEEIEKLRTLEIEQAKQKAKEEAQRRADQALMDTFPSVEDIDLGRDAKLLSVAAAVKVANSRINDYQRNLTASQEALAANQGNEKEVKRIGLYIEQLNKQLEKTRTSVLQKEQERDNIVKEYQDYKERFYNIQSTR